MHKCLVWVHPSLPVALFPLHGWAAQDSDLKQKVKESHLQAEHRSPGSQGHCMLPAPAGINESCSGLETRGQSDLNFVVLSCAKLLLTMKPAQNVRQRNLLCKRGNEAVLPLHLLNLPLATGQAWAWSSEVPAIFILNLICAVPCRQCRSKPRVRSIHPYCRGTQNPKEPTLIHKVRDHIWVHLTTHPSQDVFRNRKLWHF